MESAVETLPVPPSGTQLIQGPNEDVPQPDLLSTPQIPEKWHRTPRPRGRQRRDPQAQVIRFDCRDADDMENNLRDYLQAPTVPPEHAAIEFHFPVTSAFMVYTKDFKKDAQPAVGANILSSALRRTAVSIIEVLNSTGDPKEQMRRQKAVAKICVETVQKADGYRYSFHNNWLSREDKASRFSYFCNDSTLNKGRAANEGSGTAGKQKRKPVYDCEGLISVKFSVTKNNLEVHYRHIPLHRTYEERAPPPRRDSKRRRLLELFNPEAMTPLRASMKRRKTDVKDVNIARKKRRTTEPIATAVTNSSTVDLTHDRDGSLQPLIDFLGSAEDADTQRQAAGMGRTLSEGVRGGVQSQLEVQTPPSVTIDQVREKSSAPAATGKAKKNHVPPNIPGAMYGSMRSGNIAWGEQQKERGQSITKQGSANKPANQASNVTGAAEVASGTTQGENETSTNTMSELEALKQSLLKAEERIRRLEAEKQQAPPAYPPYPYPPPHGYPYPYPTPPHGYVYPPYPLHPPQGPQNQMPPPPQQQSQAPNSAPQPQPEIQPQPDGGHVIPSQGSQAPSTSNRSARRSFIPYAPRNDDGDSTQSSASRQNQPNMRYVTFDQEGNRSTSTGTAQALPPSESIPSKFLPESIPSKFL